MTNDKINAFIEHLTENGRSKSTIIAYTKDITQLYELAGKRELHNLNSDEIKVLLGKLKEKHFLTVKSLSRKLNSVRTFFKFLTNKKIIDNNPTLSIPHPKFRAKKQRILLPSEYNALRNTAVENIRLSTMIELLLQTGIRISELQVIKANSILPSLDFMRIPEFEGHPSRQIPLNPRVKVALKKYMTYMGLNTKSDSPLFSTKSGKMIEIRNIRSSIDRAIQKAKIKNACVNDLRNTFIVFQLQMGMSIQRLAEIVGHKNTATTQKYTDLLGKKYKAKGLEYPAEL